MYWFYKDLFFFSSPRAFILPEICQLCYCAFPLSLFRFIFDTKNYLLYHERQTDTPVYPDIRAGTHECLAYSKHCNFYDFDSVQFTDKK